MKKTNFLLEKFLLACSFPLYRIFDCFSVSYVSKTHHNSHVMKNKEGILYSKMCKRTKITSSGNASWSSTYFTLGLLLAVHHPLCHYFTQWRLARMYSALVWSAMFAMHIVAPAPACEICISNKQPHSRILVAMITAFTVCLCRHCHGKKSSALCCCLIVIMPPFGCCPPWTTTCCYRDSGSLMNSTVCCCSLVCEQHKSCTCRELRR